MSGNKTTISSTIKIMNNKQFFIECDDEECTIYYEKPYPVDITKESQYVIVMEIGFKRTHSADEYYFTEEQAIAMAKKICADLEEQQN